MPDFKFLHLADVHLDTTFLSKKAEVRERLRDDIRIAFQKGVDHAIENQFHAVLIAGDLFDGEYLSLKTERFLIEQVNHLASAGITTVYVTGNHDHRGNISRIRDVTWPDRFHLVADPVPKTIDIRYDSGQRRAKVIAAGHTGPQVSTNLAAEFPPAESGTVTVGLLHAHVLTAGGVDQHDRYAPCSRDDLETRGYTYWALGHIHRRQSLSDIAEVWYAGNIQGRHPGETGKKGGLAVTVTESGATEVSFLDLAPTRWEVLHLEDLDAVTRLEDLSAAIRKAFIGLRDGDDGTHAYILRIVLGGPCPFATTLREAGQLDYLAEMLVDELGVLDVEIRLDKLTPPIDTDSHRGQPHVLSEALALIDRLAEESELWSKLPIDSLAIDPDDRTAYLRSLLEGLDRELVGRMQHEED